MGQSPDQSGPRSMSLAQGSAAIGGLGRDTAGIRRSISTQARALGVDTEEAMTGIGFLRGLGSCRWRPEPNWVLSGTLRAR